MLKLKKQLISLSIIAAMVSTGTAPQAFAELLNVDSYDNQGSKLSGESLPEFESDSSFITSELEELRTEFSKTYERSDGSRVSVITATPIHFFDQKSNEWKSYDNRLDYDKNNEVYESKDNGSDLQVSLPKNLDDKIEVEYDGYKVSLDAVDFDADSSENENDKKTVTNTDTQGLAEYSVDDYVSDSVLEGKVTYEENDDLSVEYIFSGSSLKENIILSNIPDNIDCYTFKLSAKGLDAVLNDDNSIDLNNQNGEAIFTIPAPYMYDDEYNYSTDIKTTLKKENDIYVLSYLPSEEWLLSDERSYPVVIDPTIATKNNRFVEDTSLITSTSMDLANNPNLYVGAGGNRKVTMDSYIKFTNLPTISETWVISNAKLNLKTSNDIGNIINAYRITSDWEEHLTLANAPTYDSTILDSTSVPSSKDKWVSWDVTNTVYDWYNGGENYGIKLSSPYASSTQSSFYSANASTSSDMPYLSVQYETVSSAQLEKSRSIDIGRAGNVTVNDFSGNLVLTRSDIGFDGNVMPVNISMIYNLQDKDFGIPFGGSHLFGYGFRSSYSQMIRYTQDYGNNKYYEYVCEDGSTVYFDYDEETEEYIDRSDRGYSIEINGSSSSEYENVVISDSTDNKYYFDEYGRLVRIVSSNRDKSEIRIAYNGNYNYFYEIDYITDGSGRKYDFNYTKGMVTDISYYGTTSSVLAKVSYSYNSDQTLNTVTYPDGKSVKYSWNNRSLISAVNTDNYRVDFDYTSYSLTEHQRVSSIKEYGSNGTKGADIGIKYAPYETQYANNITGEIEKLIFNTKGDLLSSYNSYGAVIVNEYDLPNYSHGVSNLINTYRHSNNETNLLTNGEFKNDYSGWTIVNPSNISYDSFGHPGNGGSVKIVGNINGPGVIIQTINISGTKGDTFDLGGWASGFADPNGGQYNLALTFFNKTTLVNTDTVLFNPYCTSWQYAMKNIEAQGDYTSVRVDINYSGQINYAHFDGVGLYKGINNVDEDETESTSEEIIEEETDEITEPATTVDSYGNVKTTYTDGDTTTVSVVDKFGNNLSDETVINGVSLSTLNEYSQSGNYLKSSTDSSGNKTLYNYNENTGNLDSITDANGSTVNYSYDKVGNITKISQKVPGLSNGTNIENSYSYDSGDRLKSITHNGFNYTFGYSEFGSLNLIKAGTQKLVSYNYDRVGLLTSANYGNGQSINYNYNTDRNKALIKQNDTVLYSYNYDEYGDLVSVNDNVSGITTAYSENDNGEKVVEETGNGIYHKYYETENDKYETIGDITKKTHTSADDNSTVITLNTGYTSGTTHEKYTDKFGRCANEKLVIHGKAGAYSDVYNKKYSYTSPSSGKTSEQVSKITYTGRYNDEIEYKYDKNGNIIQAGDSVYFYDQAGQLTIEYSASTGEGYKYYYDAGGNLVSKKKCIYGGASVQDTVSTYTYGNSNWKDLLTEYNGKTITYDAIGNPLSYYNGMEFSWTMGRRLESITRGNSKTRYTYNANGLRTAKIINGTRFNYYWNGDKITAQTWPGNTLYFYYDNDGKPIGFDYNDSHYYYVTNLQGDITAILDCNGYLVAEYSYDAWGNCTILKNTNNIANTNPLRYRGYYYDTDTELYYLQSRYYDANTGRFINADEPEMIIQGVDNLFLYCCNNPIMGTDYSGHKMAFIYGRKSAHSYAMKWWNDFNPMFFHYKNTDCANFVSQCLFAGGIVMTHAWYSYRYNTWLSSFTLIPNNQRYRWDVSKAWQFANEHYKYFKRQSFVKCNVVIRNKSVIRSILKNRKNDIKLSDPIYFDKNSDGRPDHVGIISKITDKEIYYAGHTNPQREKKISSYFDGHKKGRVYILHINVN